MAINWPVVPAPEIQKEALSLTERASLVLVKDAASLAIAGEYMLAAAVLGKNAHDERDMPRVNWDVNGAGRARMAKRKIQSWLIRAMYGWADFWYAVARATDIWIVFFREAYRERQDRVPANEVITTEVLEAMMVARERQEC